MFKLCCIIFLLNFQTVFLEFSKSETEENESVLNRKKKLLIDTDTGTDDAVALLNLLGSEKFFQNVEIHLISAVFGNTKVDNVARNILKVLKTLDRLDIPVYVGANQSMVKTPEIENYFGEDGLGDFDFPEPPPTDDYIKSDLAAKALVTEALMYPGQLTLVCLGPLTNIAIATKLDHKFFDNLKEIYVLGGSDSGIGNIKAGVEFNFHVDPEAASIVLQEAEKYNKIINLLTWETSLVRTPIDMNWRKNVLGAINSPQVDLINKAERNSLTGDLWISADALLSSAVLEDDIIESSEIYHGDVECCGEYSRGALFIDYNSPKNSKKNIRIIKKINTEKHQNMLLQNFNSQKSPINGC